jgi:hypothetical protein
MQSATCKGLWIALKARSTLLWKQSPKLLEQDIHCHACASSSWYGYPQDVRTARPLPSQRFQILLEVLGEQWNLSANHHAKR